MTFETFEPQEIIMDYSNFKHELLCPVCGDGSVHHEAVVVRSGSSEEDCDGVHVLVTKGRSETSLLRRQQFVGRRDDIEIVGRCEQGHTFVIRLVQHKGHTFVYAEGLAGEKLNPVVIEEY